MSCCGTYMVLDSHTGDQICDICGKVEQYLNNEYPETLTEKRSLFIQDVCANNHLTKSIETQAEYLFFKHQRGGGKNTDAFAAYCIYLVCKQQQVGRSLVEVSRMCGLSPAQVGIFNVDDNEELQPSNLVARMCYKLDISGFPLVKAIEELSEKLYVGLLNSGPPNSAVAAAIAVLVQNIKPCRIAWACDISPSCLRRICKIYKKELKDMQTVSKTIPKKKVLFYADG